MELGCEILGSEHLSQVNSSVLDKLRQFVGLVLDESTKQNLISKSTVEQIWHRHIVDSLQLLPYVQDGPIVDIGSGAGFPGVVIACASNLPVILVEPRARRATFLRTAIVNLNLAHFVTVRQEKIERVEDIRAGTITARAVASVGDLFNAASRIATNRTRWILSRGQSARSELDAAALTWQGKFELVPSITDPFSAILVAEQVRRRRA